MNVTISDQTFALINSLKQSDSLYKNLRAKVCNLLSEYFIADRLSLQETAKDIVQDTIQTALTKIKEGLIINNLEAWCTTVSRNKTLDFLKKKKPVRLNEEMPEDVYSENESNSDTLLKILIGQCMQRLNENHRKVLKLYAIGNKTKEIAEVLNIPQNTILTWLTNGRTKFSECIGQN
jgi:RNA polymerase sigma-70 factor, ECF subfamily